MNASIHSLDIKKEEYDPDREHRGKTYRVKSNKLVISTVDNCLIVEAFEEDRPGHNDPIGAPSIVVRKFNAKFDAKEIKQIVDAAISKGLLFATLEVAKQ